MAFSEISYRICIPMKRDAASAGHEKGHLFERFIKLFLENQNFIVKDRFRDAGTEVDLLCENKFSNEIIVVECKAHQSSLQSEVVNKLYTDVQVFDASSGWIFSTSDLGKEARTRMEKLNTTLINKKLKFFSAADIIQFLEKPQIIKRPTVNNDQITGNEHLLCLFGNRRVWAVPVLDAKGDRPVGHLPWNADNGEEISPNNAPEVLDTDFPCAELGWLPHIAKSQSKSTELQPVVEVIPGDGWSDYRPSRPDDFVGRSALIHEMRQFLTSVINRSTVSRIFGIKGRSGWGKSSLALKLAHTFSSSKAFILPVDCRAANSSFYADLVIGRALSQAAENFSHGPLFSPKPDFRTNPFEEPSVASFLDEVSQTQGVIIIIFDQFEAVIHRAELRATFERMREIALFVDEMRGPIVIGFSWKTDGTVGSDNAGYQVWHSLSDRRRDFEVDRFTRDDADHFISLALRSAHVHLPRNVIQFILEQYAGYPWLLKKLIKHCVDDVKRAGSTVNTGTFFNISTLFQNDLQELGSSETAALRFIGRESPIDSHIAEEKCGELSIRNLIDRRLIIKSGSQLSLYWDIFRDYILNDQTPYLPNNYVPTLSVRKIRSAIKLILQNPSTTYNSLAKNFGISMATADNTVRDLTNMGLVESNRTSGSFLSCCDNPQEATRKIVNFLKSHVIFRRTCDMIESGKLATVSNIELAVQDDYAFVSIDKKTLKIYVRKLLLYCIDFGLLEKVGSIFILSTPFQNIFEVARRNATLSDDEFFRGAAPPNRVLHLLELVRSGRCQTLQDAEKLKLRNAVFAASSLKLIEHRDGRIKLMPDTMESNNIPILVAEYALRVEPIRSLIVNLDIDALTSEEIGAYLSDIFEINWSAASCRRYGLSLKNWCSWVAFHLSNIEKVVE